MGADAEGESAPAAPSLPWRIGSTLTIGLTWALCRAFLSATSTVEVNGLDEFVGLLEEREDVATRQRGLLTVSNHLSVIDDPFMWGVLPFKWAIRPDSARWSMGSHDIAFQNAFTSTFFSLGQVLPTHRAAFSKFGGLFQPTITQTIRLLSHRPFQQTSERIHDHRHVSDHGNISDPFSSAELTYSTNGTDSFPAPSAYLSRRHAWVHVFPEGMIHQKADKTIRYFKWGVSRMILESEPCPALVPIWIEGFDQVMHETRETPRFLPRPGKQLSITFGKQVDMDLVFGDLRRRWQQLVRQENADFETGELPESLKYAPAAVKLREECTMRVRDEVLKLRRARGHVDEDPKARKVDTWRREGSDGKKREGRMADGSYIKEE